MRTRAAMHRVFPALLAAGFLILTAPIARAQTFDPAAIDAQTLFQKIDALGCDFFESGVVEIDFANKKVVMRAKLPPNLVALYPTISRSTAS